MIHQECLTVYLQNFAVWATSANMSIPITISPHYIELSLDFILCCCHRDPRKRSNATRLLRHPFITGNTACSPERPISTEGAGSVAQLKRKPAKVCLLSLCGTTIVFTSTNIFVLLGTLGVLFAGDLKEADFS